MSKCKIMSPQCHIHTRFTCDVTLFLFFFFYVCPHSEICPENISPSEGLSALNSLLEKKMGHRVARLLDNLFEMFYNWFTYPFSELLLSFHQKLNRSPENGIFLALCLQPSEKHTFASCSNWFFVVLFRKGGNSRSDTWQRVPNLRYQYPLWCHKGRIPVLFLPAISGRGTSKKQVKDEAFLISVGFTGRLEKRLLETFTFKWFVSHHKMGPMSLFKAVS